MDTPEFAGRAYEKLKEAASIQNFLGLLTVTLFVIVYWDVLVQRYSQFTPWASGYAGIAASIAASTLGVVSGIAAGYVLAKLIDHVYFRPRRRIELLEQKVEYLNGHRLASISLFLMLPMSEVRLKRLRRAFTEPFEGPKCDGAVQMLDTLLPDDDE